MFTEIPSRVIPDDAKPQFRCCVFKERAIVQERVKMALPQDTDQIVQVIKPACEQCPSHRCTVTSSCQGCISKRCKENCPVGAITIVNKKAQIDYDKCIECGRCSKACPYNAITDQKRPCKASCPVDAIVVNSGETAIIDESKCISCGRCISGCPFGAIGEKTFIINVAELLMNPKEEVNAILAPAIVGQYPGVTLGQIKSGLKKMGFDHVYETAMGADVTVRKESKELEEKLKQNEMMTTSCCPSFVQLIKRHYPTVEEHISGTPSPMAELVNMLDAARPKAHTVFIGPCIAKKREMTDIYGTDQHFVLTFMEMDALFDAAGIDLSSCEELEVNDASKLGRLFPWSGGVSEAIVEYLEPHFQVEMIKANGVEECKEYLKKMKYNKHIADFMEGMVCNNGCVGGPGCIIDARKGMKAAKEFSLTATKTNHAYVEIEIHHEKPDTHSDSEAANE